MNKTELLHNGITTECFLTFQEICDLSYEHNSYPREDTEEVRLRKIFKMAERALESLTRYQDIVFEESQNG